MKLAIRFVTLALLIPLVGSAQGFKDLDSAMSGVARGFEQGDAQAVVAGLADGDQIMLQFPGLIRESGFFGRDQASYLLEELFRKANPTQFRQVSARKVSAEAQYHITGKWTVGRGAETDERDLYVTLRNKNDRWSIVSIKSTGR